MKNYYYHILAGVIVLIMAVIIFNSFPALEKYHYGADEGYYHHYSTTLKQEGFVDGMQKLSDEHAAKIQRSTIPSPLRIFHMFLLWLFGILFGGIKGLSWLSLLSYVCLVAITYVFMFNRFGGASAIIATLLLASDPLGISLSSRALMDSTNYLFIIATLLVFIHYLRNPGWRALALFVSVHSLCILEKDINAMFLPAYALVWLFFYFKERGKYPFVHGIVVAITIPLVCFLSYLLFIGWDNFASIFSDLGKAFEISPFSFYGVIYHNGPWYQFLVDYAILSPVLVMVSLFALGYLFTKAEGDGKLLLGIAGFIFFCNMVFITTVSMNVRYIIYMDWLMAITIALAVPLWIKELKLLPANYKWVATTLVALLLVGYNYNQYHRLFIQHTIYDPINYNLLVGGEIMPKMHMDAQIQEERIKLLNTPLSEEAKKLLQDAYQLLTAKQYDSVVTNCMAILQQQPYHAETYNLLCVAYNEKGMYHYAIEACNMAIVMEPEYELARNNRAWAEAQLQALQK